jgi:hypothetical protein
MLDASTFQYGAAATALTGAVIGWALRPLFVRYRRTFLTIAAAVVAVGFAVYGALPPEAQAEPDSRAAPATRVLRAAATHESASDADAYARALAANDSAVWCEYASAVARAQGGSLAGRPREIVAYVLAHDPAHPKALAMAAEAAFEARDYEASERYWQRLAAQLPLDSQEERDAAAAAARAHLMAEASR